MTRVLHKITKTEARGMIETARGEAFADCEGLPDQFKEASCRVGVDAVVSRMYKILGLGSVHALKKHRKKSRPLVCDKCRDLGPQSTCDCKGKNR
jgi:hypothetical protein